MKAISAYHCFIGSISRVYLCRIKTNDNEGVQPGELICFADTHRQKTPPGLAFNLVDYLQLVDWTGTAIRENKRGATFEDTPPILQRLNV